MTKKELVRVYVIKSLIEDKITSRDVVEVLSLSERQTKRLKADVKKDGEVFCTNYTHLSKLLREEEGITASQSSISRILKAKGIKSPRKRKPPKPHRIRERKSQEGLLLQMDTSPYE